ncbi:hypothetical protein AVEN_246822-1 [Araneus ventricosus]|uniref:Uncharacterized protein n=1 Tax=Araneus ventricosus TaxID=182803 RepID=A0A4Y2QTF0_ARAVE|nr:hypothetical protein AVEN_246822-1 [Araneus ventricosus]
MSSRRMSKRFLTLGRGYINRFVARKAYLQERVVPPFERRSLGEMLEIGVILRLTSVPNFLSRLPVLQIQQADKWSGRRDLIELRLPFRIRQLLVFQNCILC